MSADLSSPTPERDATARENFERPPDAASGSTSTGRLAAYRLIKELGRGGQGRVYLAEDERLGRRVALKVLDGATGDALGRFRREAEVASKLDHPGVCAVYEIGESDGRAYIAMRHVEGEPLSRRLAAAKSAADGSGRTPTVWSARPPATTSHEAAPTKADLATPRDDVGRTLAFVEKAARALHAAHEQGVVHRDIKPPNIMVTPDGDPVVLDFGFAGVTDDGATTLTQTGQIFGTPAYMAPEQIVPDRGKPDRRSDVWALAAVLYECLTLRRPFDRPTRDGLFTAILVEDPPDPRAFNRAVSRDVRTVLEVALEKEPRRRYQTALDFAEDLRRARAFEPIRAKPAGVAGRALRWARRRPAAAALVLTLITGAPVTAWLGATYLANRPIVEARLLSERDDLVESLMNEGFFRTQNGDVDEATALFARAGALKPAAPEPYVGEAYARLRHYRPEDGKRALVLLDALSDAFADDVLPLRLTALAVAGRGAEAEAETAATTRAASRPSRSPLWYFVRGLNLLAPNAPVDSRPTSLMYAERDAAYRAVLLSPRPRRIYFAALCEIASRVATNGDYSDRRFAKAAAESMTFHWPDDPSAWWARAVAAETMQENRDAAEFLRRGLGLLPPNGHPVVRAFYLNNLAKALIDCGEDAEADVLLRDLVAAHPDFAAAHANRVAFLQRRGRLDEAAPSLRRLIELRPEDPTNRRILGVRLLERGRVEEALPLFEQAAVLAPDHADTRHNLSNVLALLGRSEDALREQTTAARLAPEDAQIVCTLALRLADVGDSDGARAAFARAEGLDADEQAAALRESVRRRLAREAEDLPRLAEALSGAEAPEDAVDALALASLAAARGRFAAAAHLLDAGGVDDETDFARLGRRAIIYGAAGAAAGTDAPGGDASAAKSARAAWRARALGAATRFLRTNEDSASWRRRALAAELRFHPALARLFEERTSARDSAEWLNLRADLDRALAE